MTNMSEKSQNIIEFSIDLWENYLIYNLDELWSRQEKIIIKPYPSIKESYLKILKKLSKHVSIIYDPEAEDEKYYYNKIQEFESRKDRDEFISNLPLRSKFTNLNGRFDSSIINMLFQLQKGDLVDYMKAMNILPKIQGNLMDQENPFFNVRELIMEYLKIYLRLEKEDFVDEKEQSECMNKLDNLSKKLKKSNIFVKFLRFKLKRVDKKKREIILEYLEELMKKAAWFQINSKNFIDHLANKHNCVDFVEKYKETILSYYTWIEDFGLELSIWNYRIILYDVILSLKGILEKDLCEKIRSLDNIKSYSVFNTPFLILFSCTDTELYEKTPFLYKKETVDRVLRILKDESINKVN